MTRFDDLTEWVDRFRPRRWDQFLQAPDGPVIATLKRLASQERFGCKLLIDGPPGIGKTSMLRMLGARRCCGKCSPDSGDPCGQCQHCDGVFSGHSNTGNAYLEVIADRRRDWMTRIREMAADRVGNCTIPNGNPRSLVSLIVINELQQSSVSDQEELADYLERCPFGIALSTNDPAQLLPHLRDRCQRLTLRSPSRAEFLSWFRVVLGAAEIVHDADVPVSFFEAAGGAPRRAMKLADQVHAVLGSHWDDGNVRRVMDLPDIGSGWQL